MRTILIFVGKNYFSETKGGGYLKCLRGFRGGSAKCLCSSTRGRGGVKNALNSVYVVCTQSQLSKYFVFNIEYFVLSNNDIDIANNHKLISKSTTYPYFDMYRFQELTHLSEKSYVCLFNNSLSKVEVNWIKNDKISFTKIFV